MLLRKQPFIALVLLLALAGVLNAQTQTAQKNKKEKEILSTAPKPVIQLSDHPLILTPCANSAAEAQIPLTATVTNFSTTALRYSWRVSGGRLTGDGRGVCTRLGEDFLTRPRAWSSPCANRT